jgi:hypothetical protein
MKRKKKKKASALEGKAFESILKTKRLLMSFEKMS